MDIEKCTQLLEGTKAKNLLLPRKRYIDVTTGEIVGYSYGFLLNEVVLTPSTVSALKLRDYEFIAYSELEDVKVFIDRRFNKIYLEFNSILFDEEAEEGITRSNDRIVIDGYHFNSYDCVELDNIIAFERACKGAENGECDC